MLDPLQKGGGGWLWPGGVAHAHFRGNRFFYRGLVRCRGVGDYRRPRKSTNWIRSFILSVWSFRTDHYRRSYSLWKLGGFRKIPDIPGKL